MESQINTNINPDNELDSSNLKQPKCPLIEDEGSNVEIVVDDDQILQFPESTEQPMEKPINDQLVEFLRGVTNFGNLCIWHEGSNYYYFKIFSSL